MTPLLIATCFRKYIKYRTNCAPSSLIKYLIPSFTTKKYFDTQNNIQSFIQYKQKLKIRSFPDSSQQLHSLLNLQNIACANTITRHSLDQLKLAHQRCAPVSSVFPKLVMCYVSHQRWWATILCVYICGIVIAMYKFGSVISFDQPERFA